eukprot:1296733-Rhodomonas_salina.1
MTLYTVALPYRCRLPPSESSLVISDFVRPSLKSAFHIRMRVLAGMILGGPGPACYGCCESLLDFVDLSAGIRRGGEGTEGGEDWNGAA